jgi:hypothetical protein
LSIQREAQSLFGKRAGESRRIALYLSHRLSGQSLGEIGSHFGGISPSAVSQNTRRFEERLKEEEEKRKKAPPKIPPQVPPAVPPPPPKPPKPPSEFYEDFPEGYEDIEYFDVDDVDAYDNE